MRAALLACFAIAVSPPALGAQDAPAERSTGPVTPAEADAIRDTLRRPPGRQPTDWVDVAEFPLKVIGWPLDLLLVRFPGWVVGQITAPRPPSLLVRTYRGVSAWGLQPTIRTTIGPRSGAAAELQLDRFYPFYLHAAVSTSLSQRYRGGLMLAGRKTWLAAEVKWQRDAETPFYGIGPGTTKQDRSFYRRDWWHATARTGYALSPGLVVAGGVGYEHNRVGDPVNGDLASIFDDPGTETLFGATETTEYAVVELSGTLDLTRWRDFQQTGVTLGLAGRTFLGLTGTDSDFALLTGFVQTYLPINGRQSLALRAISDIARDSGGDGVPFYHLSKLGGSRSALGYPSARFVDNDMLALMSEWRYEVWRELHGRMRAETFLFLHYGAVERTLGRIASEDWHPSYGVGLRLSRRTALLGLGYLGFSSEGLTAGIRGSWPF